MKNSQKSLWTRPMFLRIVSFILAIVLYLYVNGGSDGFLRQTTRGNNDSSTSILNSSKSTTVKMPLTVNVNTDKYVVTGYPQFVKVKLTGPSALVTTSVNTQNFKAYVNLSDLTAGEHTVKVKTSGLNSNVKATVDPAKITVNIEPRSTITASVKVQLSNTSLDGGYKLGTAKPALDTVQVTGARSEVQQVSQVVVYVKVPKSTTATLHQQVTLQAVDKNGKALNVVVTPGTITVTVPVSADNQSSSSQSSNSTSDSATSSTSSSSDTSGSSSSSSESSSSSDK